MARTTEFGTVVRYVPAPEPLAAVATIGLLTLTQMAMTIMFIVLLITGNNNFEEQALLAFLLGTALLNLAAILSLYRRYFLPDVMIVKKRKQKYEDLI